MIDFVSTRTDVDPQVTACARLLTAVISLAIQDAKRPLLAEEKRHQQNRDEEADQAIRFLFGDAPAFTVYASMIGSSADTIRRALTEPVGLCAPSLSKHFNDRDRTTIRTRRDFFTKSIYNRKEK